MPASDGQFTDKYGNVMKDYVNPQSALIGFASIFCGTGTLVSMDL